MNILAVIPARYNSSRFPGKPLIDIGGKSMIERVYTQVQQASGIAEIVVATDDERIVKAVQGFGGKFVMTSPEHPSGTDRCAEALEALGGDFDAVMNIQGDEPFIHPEQIDLVAGLLRRHNTEIATLARKIHVNQDIFDPSKVKVVFDNNRKALYFSRSPVPFDQMNKPEEWLEHTEFFLHVGIYGYTADVLRDLTGLRVSSLEKAESLEQLRWLQNGYNIHLDLTTHISYGVDTPADLERVMREMNGRQ